MKKYLFIISLAFATFYTQASKLINDERVIDQKNCFSGIFANYDSWRNFMKTKYEKRAKSKEVVIKKLAWFDSIFGTEKFNQYKSKLTCSNFKYTVDGNTVNGYVIKPKTSTSKLPVLIYNRGGNGNYGGVVFGTMMNFLFPIANEGFVIVGSQYRGTFVRDSSVHDEFGGSDVNDVVALLNFIPNINGADEQRIGMYGGSRGGMQTHLATKETNKIKAIATLAGATDLLKELKFRPAMENVYIKRIPNYEQNKIAELEKRSVLKWVDKLSPNIPILLLHGENDKRVSVNNSIEFANALTKYNIPHKLVVYPGDNHGLNINKSKADAEVVNWFKKYL